jgi:hypothetical protein
MNIRLWVTGAAVILFAGCKSAPLLESQWRDRAIAVDGNSTEWNDLIQYPRDSKIGIGVINDDVFLYLCLTSEDRAITSQIFRYGFTMLFQSRAQKEKLFGVRFPMGGALSGAPPDRHTGMERDTAMMREHLEAALQTLALLGPGKDDTVPLPTRIAESLGVAVAIKPSHEDCVYELKVPLNQDSICKYAINAGKDTLFEVTLESSAPERESSRPSDMGDGRGFGGGGMHGGGRGGGMGGGMGGMHGGGRYGGGHRGGGGYHARAPEPFSQTFTIKLAQKPVEQR